MSSFKSYIQYFAVVLLLSLCSITKVSSMKCYSCDSDINKDCIYKPTRYGVTCAPYKSLANTFLHSNFNAKDAIGTRAISYDCAFAVGISTKDGSFRLVRGCSVKPVTCATYQTIYAVNYNFQVDQCNRCGYDFCNNATF